MLYFYHMTILLDYTTLTHEHIQSFKPSPYRRISSNKYVSNKLFLTSFPLPFLLRSFQFSVTLSRKISVTPPSFTPHLILPLVSSTPNLIFSLFPSLLLIFLLFFSSPNLFSLLLSFSYSSPNLLTSLLFIFPFFPSYSSPNLLTSPFLLSRGLVWEFSRMGNLSGNSARNLRRYNLALVKIRSKW